MATIEVCDRCQYPKRDKMIRHFSMLDDPGGKAKFALTALLCDKCCEGVLAAISAKCIPPKKRKAHND